MANKIEILDSIMGSGKTQGIIRWMNERPQEKFMYVSPLLTEVEDRIPESCEGLGFVSPNTVEHGTKSDHLLELLKEGYNVSFTHSLFENLTKQHLEWVKHHQYILIIDEEIDFIETYQGREYKNSDILTLEQSGHIKVDEDNLGLVKWVWEDDRYKGGSYDKLRNMCELEMLHCAKRDRGMLVVHLPIALITSAARVIVMTYLFKNSIMARFMEMKGISVSYFDEVPMQRTEAEIKQNACERIELVTNRSLPKVNKFQMSSTWYSKAAKPEQLKQMSNTVLSFCKMADDKSEIMMTFPKGLRHDIAGKNTKRKISIRGYNDDIDYYWVFCGTKATNLYTDRTFLIHAFNRYPSLPVSSYLIDYKFPLNEDEYALSEMIQWVWRSKIREKDGRIKLAILHPRMRKLFTDWLNGEY